MKGKKMGTVVQLLQRPADEADTPADVSGADIVDLPFRRARHQIAGTAGKCEMLRQGIDVLRDSIGKLEGVVGLIDDHEMREELQQRLSSMNEMLLLRSIQLSSINDMLKVRLRRARRSRY
jgi:hypothetical protein